MGMCTVHIPFHSDRGRAEEQARTLAEQVQAEAQTSYPMVLSFWTPSQTDLWLQVAAALLKDEVPSAQQPAIQGALPSADGIARLSWPGWKAAKGSQEQQQQQTQEEGPAEQLLLPAPTPPPEKAMANPQEKGQRVAALVNRMVDNGFFVHRLVRARLLHYFICQILGAPAVLSCMTLPRAC